DKMKIIENRERSIQKKFRVNEKENERIKLMMKKTGITNFSIFARRACCNKEIFSIVFQNIKILFLKFLRQNLN
ncbi:plasmid mobilization protein, partial [Lactococcus cremoris]|uniref:plasmid mobilization protein n=1 Tax=Lactococcus lactis subsp. cremoris TaxID=1359 RepID=UPI00406468D0